MTPSKASARMTEQKHPTQSPDKHADIAQMLSEFFGPTTAYDSTFEAWLLLRNDYDALYVDIEFDATPDRSPSREVYRLTMERVS